MITKEEILKEFREYARVREECLNGNQEEIERFCGEWDCKEEDIEEYIEQIETSAFYKNLKEIDMEEDELEKYLADNLLPEVYDTKYEEMTELRFDEEEEEVEVFTTGISTGNTQEQREAFFGWVDEMIKDNAKKDAEELADNFNFKLS